MTQDVQSAGPGDRRPAHLAPWLVAGFLAMAAAWTSAAVAPEPADPASQGIRIHGDWTITVSDSDGREVSTRHFRNALLPSGESLLVRLLSFGSQIDSSLSNWRILVVTTGTVDNEECNALTGIPLPENSVTFSPATQAILSLNQDGTTFTLERDLKVPANCISGANYSILEVVSAAQFKVDSGGFFPDPVTALPERSQFTKKVLDTPVAVLPGQVVSLSVTFSFS